MANEQNLIPLNKRSKEDAKKIRVMGGKATKGIPRYGITTCKSCKLPCPLKDEGKENKWKCKIPDVKRMILEAFLDPSKLKESMFVDLMKMQSLAGEDFYKNKAVFDSKLSLNKELENKRAEISMKDGMGNELTIKWVGADDRN